MQTEIWQHRKSGELYLARVERDGDERSPERIATALGPVSRADAEYTVNEGAGWFNGDSDDAEDLRENPDAYRVIYPFESA